MPSAQNLFNYAKYKDYLEEVLHSKSSRRGLQSELARHIPCQAAYLYQVLKGKSDLTEDQAYKVTTFFEFSSLERDYFLLLLRSERAATQELKDFLIGEIKAAQEAQKDLRHKADSNVATDENERWDYYFSSELPALIHMLTSSDKFQEADAISKRLRVSPKTVRAHLTQLSRWGLVEKSGEKWIFSGSSFHFPTSSRFNRSLQTIRRVQALRSVVQDQEDSTHFSSLFTLDKPSFMQLQTLVSKFVKESQSLIHKGGTDELYVFSLDLFAP